MKRFLQISLLMLCLTSSAQITFEKGYFINNGNEKIECFIKNPDWKDNPTEFEYKINLDESKSSIGNITSVKEFSIEGENKYKRFEVNIEKSNDNLRNLTENKNPVWNKETLFLKVLVEGEASLYGYSNSSIYKYFYTTKTIPIEQLICIKYKSFEKNSDNLNSYEESIKTNNAFRQQLYNNVKIDVMSGTQYQSIGYNSGSLINYFSKYNNQEGNTTNSYTTKINKGKVNIKLTAGIGSATVDVHDPNPYYSVGNDVSGLVYNFGAEVEYTLPFNKNKWSVFANPIYQRFEASKSYSKPDGFPVPHDIAHTMDVKYISFELPIGVRYYMFLNENSKIFLSGIFSVNFSSDSSIIFDKETNNSKVFEIKPLNNFAVGMGYTFKNRYSVELRAHFNRPLIDYVEWSATYNSVGVQLSYKLF